jgi:PAS domain S-box-containing protein
MSEDAERPKIAGAVGEALLRSIVSISTDAIISIDEQQKIWLFNAGAEQTFGYQAEEVLGRSLSLLIPSRFRSSHDRYLQSFSTSGASARTMGERMEVYGVRSNGEEFPAEAAISKTWLGGRRYFTVVLRDITSRKKAEDILRRSEERFRQLAESVREVFWIREAGSGAVDYVSPAYDEVFGQSRARLYENPGSFLDLVHPADVASVLSTWDISSDAPPVTFRIIREDGQMRWLESRAFPVRDPGGRVVRYVGVADDITDRHRRERLQGFLAEAGVALAASLEYHETLQRIARLAVEHFGEWCVLYLPEEDGVRVEVASSMVDGQELAEKAQGYLLTSGAPGLLERVMENGSPTVIMNDDGDPGTNVAGDALRTVMEVLGAKRAMVVPITARDQTLGAIAFFSSEGGRRTARTTSSSRPRWHAGLGSRSTMPGSSARRRRRSGRATTSSEPSRTTSAIRSASSPSCAEACSTRGPRYSMLPRGSSSRACTSRAYGWAG